MLGKDGTFVKTLAQMLMTKLLIQRILLGMTGCMVLILVFSYGLSLAINDAIANFKTQTSEFLPINNTESSTQDP